MSAAWPDLMSKFLGKYTLIFKDRQSPHPHSVSTERILDETAVAIARTAHTFTSMVCLLFLALLMPNSPMMRAGPIFAAVNVFLALRIPLTMIPMTIVNLQHMAVSFDRVTEFLLLPEFKPAPVVAPGSRRIREGDVVLRIPGKSRWAKEGQVDLNKVVVGRWCDLCG